MDALKAMDITPVLVQGYTNQQADFTPVALAIRSSGADILGSYFTFETDLGVFARQLRQLGVRVPWVGSASIVNTSALNLGGPSLYNTYGVADFAVDANPAAKAFAAQYQAKTNTLPDNQSSYAFDAVNILAKAIAAAGSTDPRRSAPPYWRSMATWAPRASTTSTPTAMGCTATTWCATKAAR